MSKFHVSLRTSQIDLFVFLAATAAGTILGGPIGDRFGRKYVIWISILGVLPFTLLLPHATLFWTPILSVVIGLILASAFSAIVVYAQELVPGRVGLISGVFFGLAFGLGGVGAAPHAALLLRDVSLLPWVALMVAAILLLGWLTANGCMAVVIREADREREQVQQRMRAGIADVARQYVVAPVERELSEFARFHDELLVARATT